MNTGQSTDIAETRRLLPPHYLLALLAILPLLAWPGPRGPLPLPWALVGVVPAVLGIWIMVAGSRAFAAAGTAIVPGQPATRLVTTGPFRFSRNPMYLGMVLLLVGGAVVLNAPLALLAPLAMYAILRFGFIRAEEAQMQAQFGAEYADYRSRVRRWL